MTKNYLPPSTHYQYFSHLFHSEQLIPYHEYTPLEDWNYPPFDLQRFTNLFLQDLSYVQNNRILDLGCHTGYFAYIAKWLGANTVHGVNARDFPLTVANYAHSQLGVEDYTFDQHDIEDLKFLTSVCQNKDTVIMTLVLEHLRNPYAVLETISASNIQNFILESSLIENNNEPLLRYYFQSTESAFTVYDEQKKLAVGSCPNLVWLEQMLYYFGWKIEYHKVERQFNSNWFATPDLEKFPPKTSNSVIMLCKKFKETSNLKKNWEI